MTSKESREADRLVGQLETLLDQEFLMFAYQGGMFCETSAGMAIALAMAHSKGFAPSRDERQHMVTCHNELMHLVHGELTLHKAVKKARMQQPAKAAFNQLQVALLDKIEGSEA